mgnify:FL=1
MVNLLFWDGVGCIGGNKILVQDSSKDESLLLDFGKNFGEENKYFDEFLKPRDRLGVYDLLRMRMLPPMLNLYRKDLIPANFDFSTDLQQGVKPVGGLLLSHAHLDHAGYLPYLREDLPVTTSVISGALLKSLQDTNRQLYSELIAVVAKELLDTGILKTAKGSPLQPRPFHLLQRPKDVNGFNDNVWNCNYTKKPYLSATPDYLENSCQIAKYNIKAWPVDHSIPGAMAYAVETSEGWIVYTGDLRLHGSKGNLTRAFFQEAAQLHPLLLITEGTHPEETNPVTEEQVKQRSMEVVAKTEGLVIADFGARNVERLLSFLQVASETQRYLVLTPKDFLMLEYLNYATPEVPNPLRDPWLLMYVTPKGRTDGWEDHVRSLVPEEKTVDARRIRSHPDDYILCFSYYDFANLLDIDVHKGSYIYSSSEPFNEEMAMDHEKIKNWIDLFGFRIYGRLGQAAGGKDERDPFHASGHIHAQGLEEMIETIRPKYLIPVHTEKSDFFQQFQGLTTILTVQRNKLLRLD